MRIIITKLHLRRMKKKKTNNEWKEYRYCTVRQYIRLLLLLLLPTYWWRQWVNDNPIWKDQIPSVSTWALLIFPERRMEKIKDAIEPNVREIVLSVYQRLFRFFKEIYLCVQFDLFYFLFSSPFDDHNLALFANPNKRIDAKHNVLNCIIF